ncbi:NAD(P)H azoreductase [Corynebacterium occultum]|uniref:NAD(P)H azoreductase n=1 Tax=Corynebacterium occultum TaxID=2675219 RepID=A0A6B8W510_9CORY|nr:NAD(P)H-binding protein [Corynebacterium occultum]QGU07027.1 NAD(P)H azoreductase [Corynebacterium occultum]
MKDIKEPTSKIVLSTPTGNVGSRVAQLLVQAGIRPTLLLRNAAKLDPALRERCDIHELDQGDTNAVVRATAGATALHWVNPPTLDDDPVAGHIRMGRSAAAAVRENQIPRVVFQSSGGAEARAGFGDIDGLGYTEELLDATGTNITHLRCGYFFTNLLMDLDSIREGKVGSTLPVDHRMPWVAPRDIAEVAATRLLSTEWHGRHTQGVQGPEDLSFREVAQILSSTLGRKIEAQQIPEEIVAANLHTVGLGEKQIQAILGMSRGQLDPAYVPENPRSYLSTTPTTLRAWAHEVLRPLL